MEPERTITLQISETHYRLLSVLVGEIGANSVEDVILMLIDHAQQGVYRPGAWERQWLIQCFGDGWVNKLKPGDPYGRAGGESIFQQPR